MLYLIAGPPRCGKTTLAAALAHEHRMPYFSMDHLANLITPYIPAERHDEAFPLAALRRQVDNNNDRFFEIHGPEEIVSVYLRQAATCWPGIRNFINYLLADNHSVVLEGWQMLPELLHQIPSIRNPSHAQVVYLYKADVRATLSGLKTSKKENDWVLNNTNHEATFQRIAEMIVSFGRHIAQEASTYRFPVLSMDSDFDEKVRNLLDGAPEPDSESSS